MPIKTILIISIALIFVLLHIIYFCLLKNRENKENREKYDDSPSWYDRRSGIYKGSGEIGGVVWTNSSYDVAREDPGLSWVL